MLTRRFSSLLLILALAGSAGASESATVARSSGITAEAARAQINELALASKELGATERHQVGPLSSSEFQALSEQTPGGPLRVGLTRYLTQPLELRDITLARATGAKLSTGGGLLRRENDGSMTWTFAVGSTAAHALRLHFDHFVLPEGARAYVYSDDGEVHGPYTNQLVRKITPDGSDFWTNAIYASTLYLEVRFAEAISPLDLSIDAVAHIELPSASEASELVAKPEATECFIDVACAEEDASLINDLSKAAAQLTFAKSGLFYLCTGSLVNETKTVSELEPYLLTANHCFDSQSSATSLEALWDYRAASCGAAPPSEASLPRSLGSTLLASDVVTDFTLVRLAEDAPGSRILLGWNAGDGAVTNGMTFYRVSHPSGGAQRFSRSSYKAAPTTGICDHFPLTTFLYSGGTYGGTTGGSSGAPMTNSQGQILGQLYGKCGFETSNPCDHTQQSAVDGKFSVTYPFVQQWLNPATGPTDPCTASSTTLCAQSNRFAITLFARDPRTGATDSGYVMASTNVFGYFAFPVLTGNQTDPQIFIKVLDGRPINNKWWVFYASLTDVEFTLTVLDTQTGTTKTYYQAPYTQKAANDTSAFN